MDFYFTDRSFKLLGIASTDGGGIGITNDIDDEFAPNSVGRTYTATLTFDQSQIAKVKTMAAFGNFVLYKDERDRYLFMTVMEWTGFDDLAGTLTFVAENGGVDLINETVGAYTAAKPMTAADYINYFTTDSGFEIGINEMPTQTKTLSWTSEDDTALARIEDVASDFNAELDFRFAVSGTAVVKRYIDIYKHIGADKGQRLEVNTHLNNIVTTGNIYGLYTSVYPKSDSGSDSTITLKGYKWTDPTGRYVLNDSGTLMDTVANQKWSRLGAAGKAASLSGGYINRIISYTASSQAELLQSALADLKTATEPVMTYQADAAYLPDGIDVGDTVHLVDEAQGLNLSSRLIELQTSYSTGAKTATFGEYSVEQNQISPQLQKLADQLKNVSATTQYFPWTMYADDDQGKGISSDPAGKSYMATVWSTKKDPSTDPADYAGHWALIKGADGVGTPGPKGADGKTSYLHIAYADDASGNGFSQDPAGKKYIGTYTDFTLADSASASAYKWALIKGADGASGKDGAAGKDGVGVVSTTITYCGSTSGTVAPSSGFTSTVPDVAAGQYLWTKTIWNYSDGTSETGYSVSHIGKDGANGQDGIAGKDGVGIKSTTVTYAASTSGTTAPTSGWAATPPADAVGQYVWTKTTWTYTDGTTESGYSVGRIGKDGSDADDSAQIASITKRISAAEQTALELADTVTKNSDNDQSLIASTSSLLTAQIAEANDAMGQLKTSLTQSISDGIAAIDLSVNNGYISLSSDGHKSQVFLGGSNIYLDGDTHVDGTFMVSKLNEALGAVQIDPGSITITGADDTQYSVGIDPTDGIMFKNAGEVIAGMHGGYDSAKDRGLLDEYLQPAGNAFRWGYIVSDTEAHIIMNLYKDEASANKDGHPAGLVIAGNLQVLGQIYSRSGTNSAAGHVHFSEYTSAKNGGIELINDVGAGILWRNDGTVWVVKGTTMKQLI